MKSIDTSINIIISHFLSVKCRSHYNAEHNALPEKEVTDVLIMIGFEDEMRTQQEVRNLFNENHPNRTAITRSTVSKI